MITRFALLLVLIFAGCGSIMEKDGLPKGHADAGRKVDSVTLQYAEAIQVFNALKILLGDPPSPPIVADPRTNSIIILGSPEEISRVKKVISVMDKKSPMTVE